MIPYQLQHNGNRFCLVQEKEKIPFEKNWQGGGYKHDDPTVQEHIKRGGNVGILTGRGIIIIDCDCQQAENMARIFPETMVVGTSTVRNENHQFRKKHFYFKTDLTHKYVLKDYDKHLGEIQALGQQCLIPPSVHPSGAHYEVIEDRPIAQIDKDIILRQASPFIVDSSKDSLKIKDIVKDGLKEGARNDTLFRRACTLRKQGIGGDETLDIIAAINDRRCSPPLNVKEIETIIKSAYSYKETLQTKTSTILLPALGKTQSQFAADIAEYLGTKERLFFRAESRDIVEVGTIRPDKDGDEEYVGFLLVKPNRFITVCERFFTTGQMIMDKEEGWKFTPKSMAASTAAISLESPQLQNELPVIKRVFTTPIPIMYNGKLTFPKKGYDQRFNSWLPYNAPEITEPNMTLKQAKNIIYDIFREFCFESKHDHTNAVAGLLTPFLRGLYSDFTKRTPVFFYMANRERAGKDYLSGITGIVYEGVSIESPPISMSGKNRGNADEELRKRFLSALIGGRKRMHFSNNKGYINNAVLEAIVTLENFEDRVLGRSINITFGNEMEFSLSGNVGITFTADFAARCRFIRLHFGEEYANDRRFEKPDLHGWILKNREKILSALYTLVRNWVEKNKPMGNTPFTSYPQWAEICGGIMESANYESPCTPDKDIIGVGGDRETAQMKELFETCYEISPDKPMKQKDIIDIIRNDDINIFGYFDFEKRGDQTKFGKLLLRYIGRIFSDITLDIQNKGAKGARREFVFTTTVPIIDKSKIFEDVKM